MLCKDCILCSEEDKEILDIKGTEGFALNALKFCLLVILDDENWACSALGGDSERGPHQCLSAPGLSNGKRGKGQKLIYGKWHLNMRKNVFAVQWLISGMGCLQRLWSLPLWRYSRTLNAILCNVLWDDPAWARRMDRRLTVVPSNLAHSVIDPVILLIMSWIQKQHL